MQNYDGTHHSKSVLTKTRMTQKNCPNMFFSPPMKYRKF